LSGGERRLAEEASTSKDNEHSNYVDSELELKELAHVVKDVAAILDSSHNIAEIVLHKLDITGVLGNISTSNSHSEADVRSFQSRSVVCSITCHCYGTANFDQTMDEQEFVIRLRSGHNLELLLESSEGTHVVDFAYGLGYGLFTFCAIFIRAILFSFFLNDLTSDLFGELRSFHADLSIILRISDVRLSNNSSFKRDCSSRLNVVTSDHAYIDTSLVAGLNSLSNTISEGILQTENSNHGEARFNLFFGLHVAIIMRRTHLAPLLLAEVAIGHK